MRARYAMVAPLVGWLAACGDNGSPEPASPTGGSATSPSGAGGAGNPSTGGTPSTTGGTSSGTAGHASGAPSTGGTGGTGGSATAGRGGTGAGMSGTTGGTSGSGNGGTLGMAGKGGAGGDGATTSAGGSAGTGAGGMPTAGSGNGGKSGSPAGGTGNTTACTRDLLKSTTDAYFVALAAHDPSTLPLAASVKFTENAKAMDLGSAGLWTTAGALKYKHSALDTMECTAATQAVVADGSTDIPLALRLKLEAGKLIEIEHIAIHSGDYSVASNTAALASSNTTVHWEDPVATDQQNTRDEITGWMNKYFRMFPSGVCNVASNCTRIENGGGNYSCSAGATCSAGQPGPGDNALTPRLILADVDTGMGVGFTYFQNMYTDMHMFKMYGDQVHEVSAILGKAGNSGWD